MTDDELQPHVGSLVVVKFVDGRQVLGKLVTDSLPGCAYAIEQGPMLHGIPDAADLEWLKAMDGPPETIA